MNQSELKSTTDALDKACGFLTSLASDLNGPQLWQMLPAPESEKTDKGVVIAFTGSEEEIQIAVDFVHNLALRRLQQAAAANN